jgi:hypothetical protein
MATTRLYGAALRLTDGRVVTKVRGSSRLEATPGWHMCQMTWLTDDARRRLPNTLFQRLPGREAEMNTSLQIAIARDHHQQLQDQAAKSRLAATVRGSHPGVLKSWFGTVRVHVPGVRTSSARLAH